MLVDLKESARLVAMLDGSDSKPRLATVSEWFAILRSKVASGFAEKVPISGPGIQVQILVDGSTTKVVGCEAPGSSA